MGRSPTRKTKNANPGKGLKKGPWTEEEDQKLLGYINKHGSGSWQLLAQRAGLNRCGKSCRLRWTNYLRPDIKLGNFSPDEEQIIIHLHSTIGNKWSVIASHLPGRTDNEIKNFWNTRLRKKLLRSGVDPNTHQLISRIGSPINSETLENLAKILLLQTLVQILNTAIPFPSILEPPPTLNTQFNRPPDAILLDPFGNPPEITDLENGNLSSSISQPVLDNFIMTPDFDNSEFSLPEASEIPMGDRVCDAPVMDEQDSDSFWREIFVESFMESLE